MTRLYHKLQQYQTSSTLLQSESDFYLTFALGRKLAKKKDNKMTRIRKNSPSIAEQIPKQMARILYNRLIQETQRSSSEIRPRSASEPSRQSQEIGSTQDELLTVVEPMENSTWRIGLHKRTSNYI